MVIFFWRLSGFRKSGSTAIATTLLIYFLNISCCMECLMHFFLSFFIFIFLHDFYFYFACIRSRRASQDAGRVTRDNLPWMRYVVSLVAILPFSSCNRKCSFIHVSHSHRPLMKFNFDAEIERFVRIRQSFVNI